MHKKPLSISELENLTGINRRTIHFYTKKRLIPPPEGLGGGARYGEETYLRLRLIKELQKSHLKLSGIKEALDAMTIEEMRDLVNKAKGSEPVWDKDSLENWLQGVVIKESVIHEDKSVKDVHMSINDNFSFLKIGAGPKSVGKIEKANISYLKKLKRYQKEDLPETKWTRIVITDGIEVNIRSDIQKKHASVISKWIQYLKRKILKGGY